VAEEIRIADNRAAGRYEAQVGDRLAGFAEYEALPGHVVFTHTKVLPEFEGRGVGARLASSALEDVRARGLTMTPQCPFIAAYVARHPAYADLIGDPPASSPESSAPEASSPEASSPASD
jgi:predicted GNAT family acetyltransferase